MQELMLQKMREAVNAAGAKTSVDICCGSSVRGSFGIDRDIAGLRKAGKPAINADAMLLPLQSQAVDATICFEGMHHLKDPYLGIKEMARASKRAVVFFEPLDVRVTRFALSLGIAKPKEGRDRVQRLDIDKAVGVLGALGFNEVRVQRMWYFAPHNELNRLVDKKPFAVLIQGLMHFLNIFAPWLGNRALFVAVSKQPDK